MSDLLPRREADASHRHLRRSFERWGKLEPGSSAGYQVNDLPHAAAWDAAAIATGQRDHPARPVWVFGCEGHADTLIPPDDDPHDALGIDAEV